MADIVLTVDGVVVYRSAEVDPTPDPIPDPVDPPVVTPPVIGEKPADEIVTIDRNNFVIAQDLAGQGYVRQQEYIEWNETEAEITFWNLSGHTRQTFPADKEFRLLVDGKIIATTTLTKPSQQLRFVIDEATRKTMNKWVRPTVEGFSTFPVAVFVHHSDPRSEWMPEITSSHEFSLRRGGHVTVKWIRAEFKPVAQPLSPREFTPYRGSARLPGFVSEELVIGSGATVRRPNITKSGVMTTFNLQRYHYHHIIERPSPFPIIEGPRGIGNVQGVLFLYIGNARRDTPDSPLMGNIYGLTVDSFFRVSPDGTVTVLGGIVTDPPGNYWEDGQNHRLVGNWSNCPNPGLWQPWSFAVDPRSVVPDLNAPWVLDNGIMRPEHPRARFLIADTRNNRILQGLAPKEHGGEFTFTVFIDNLKEPFQVSWWRGSLIITERLGHRITQYNGDTGEYERTICEGSALADIPNRKSELIRRLDTLANIRLQDCVMPEGGGIVTDEFGNENGEYVFASQAMAQVKRINLITGEWGKTINIQSRFSTGNKFATVCLSDGTFGPLGMNMSGQYQADGMDAYLPDGTKWQYGFGPSVMYNICGAIKNGRFIYAGAGEGIYEMRKAN